MAGKSTTILHAGDYEPKKSNGAVIPPIHLSTTFEFGNPDGLEYSRSGNPSRNNLESVLAELDGAKYALAYSSGSAALSNISSLLSAGDTILFSSDAYGGTYRFIVEVLSKRGVNYLIADLTDLDEVRQVVKENKIQMIWAESPTNPLLKVVDIEVLAEIAHANEAILSVDNTFATPIIQLPLEQGADIVVYSTTKYINGHSDSVGGSLATSSDEIFEKLKFLQNAIGDILSPFDSWLTLRGLRTLELRMERHVDNAVKIVEFLSENDKVKNIYFPGLFTGAQKDIVDRQMKSPGAMISFELKDNVDTEAFRKKLELFSFAESLGGVESLIEHPASMTHAAIPKDEREKIGLSDGLFRLSPGIENTQDLISDLESALKHA